MPRALHSVRYKRFQALLIEARKGADLTQAEVATKLGKHQSFVAKYEQGERRLDVVEFLEIAQAIGCDPLRLLKTLQK
jgi:transcriptional regulator with XRE-family HTH domain